MHNLFTKGESKLEEKKKTHSEGICLSGQVWTGSDKTYLGQFVIYHV